MKVSCVVGMFKVRARKRSAVIVGGEAVVSGAGWVVSSCVELCIIWKIRITLVRDCVGCCTMMSLMVTWGVVIVCDWGWNISSARAWRRWGLVLTTRSSRVA